MFYYLLKYVLLGPLLRLVFRPRIEGLEHVPAEGAAIVAGNHLSFSDHFLMPAVLKRRITFLAKAEYFTGPGIKGRLTASFFRSAGQIPVDRSGKDAGQAAIREGLGVLSKDELLGIYPEGTRSHDGRLYKGKVGVAVMALKAGVPVIPCAMIGTFEAQPPGKVIPNVHPVVIRFGKPLDFSRYEGPDPQPPTVAEIGSAVDAVMGVETETVLVDGAAPSPSVGSSPWSVELPVVFDMSAAERELGYRPVVSYPESLPETVDWLTRRLSGQDWREAFPTLARIYPDLFDYTAEDAWFGE
ncbi:hypothetical protein SVIOM74S_06996 [Streptomyces violarus]